MKVYVLVEWSPSGVDVIGIYDRRKNAVKERNKLQEETYKNYKIFEKRVDNSI